MVEADRVRLPYIPLFPGGSLEPRDVYAPMSRFSPILGLTICGLLCAGPATGQADDAGAAQRIRNGFQRGASTAKAAARCREVLISVGSVDSGPVADAMIGAYLRLEKGANTIRTQRRKILLAGGGSQKLGPLRWRLQPIREIQELLLKRLMRMNSRPAVGAMLAAVLGKRGRLPWTLSIEFAGRSADASATDLEALLASTSSVRGTGATLLLLRAIEPLGARGRKAGAWVVSLLGHELDDVRAQVVTTLGKLNWPGAIRPLIERLAIEKGEIREHILDALVVLTAVYPGGNAHAWRLWLAKEGAPYLDGTITLGRGKLSMRRRKHDPQATAGTYFGLRQQGKAILYAIDISLSMRRSASGDGDMGGGESGQKTRWDLCREELAKALRGLEPDTTFNIIGFANHLKIFDKKMKKASKRNVSRAIDWIEGLKLELETNIYDALELSFFLGGRGVRDRYYKPEIDTIYFLSDGAPTMPREKVGGGGTGTGPGGNGGGRMTRDRPYQILAEVRRFNALTRVQIFTIGLGLQDRGGGMVRRRPGRRRRGGGGPRGFLENLASQNRGKFVEPK
jgi:hypothetical protein